MRNKGVTSERRDRRLRFESLEGRLLLTTIATLGNSSAGAYQYVDSWVSNLIVNETDTFTNLTADPISFDLGSVQFVAQRLGGPVTPFLVQVNGDNNFTVLAVGQSRSSYSVGANTFEFGASGAGLSVQPGQELAVGFINALADGTGGIGGAVVAFNAGGDEIWLTGGPAAGDSGNVTGSAPQTGTFTDNFQRDYAFSVALETSDSQVLTVLGGTFETPVLPVGVNSLAEAPLGWVRSGAGTAGLQRGSLPNVSGTQYAYLQGNVLLTTGVGVTPIQAGSYQLTVALGNINGSGTNAEPGTYIVRLGYGRDANDFRELATKVLYGDAIPENQWRDLAVNFTVSDTSDALGQQLLVQVEHAGYYTPPDGGVGTTYRWQRGAIDNVRINYQSAAPVLELPDWPTAPGQALLSDKYRVWVTQNGVRREAEVLMSNSIDPVGGIHENTDNRTFSWVSLASNYAQDVTIEIEKIYGTGAPSVEVLPSGYGISHTLSPDGKTVTFTLDRSRYVSVNFQSADNKRTTNGLIDNQLMIFADDLETYRPSPTAPGTVVMTPTTTQTQLNAATVIYIPRGFYRFQDMFGKPVLEMRSGQTVYAEAGAFVLGLIKNASGQTNNMAVRGRGAFSGRELVWTQGVTTTPPRYDLVELEGNDNLVEGIFTFDGNHHGLVTGNRSHIEAVKMWGWHFNSDGARPWGGAVHRSFLRPTDDAFYVGGRPLSVTDTVIWQSYNGGVVTYGWGDYDQSAFYMKDSHVINPEWRTLHNNNGFLMSQSPATVEQYDVRFENITIDGNLPGLTNIKLGSNASTTVTASQIGELKGLSFKNIKVNGSFLQQNVDRNTFSASKSLLQGSVLNAGANKFWVRDVTFDRLIVGGTLVTEANKATYFTIDANTTQNIVFTASALPSTAPIGDFNADGQVNSADYTIWRDRQGQTSGAGPGQGDADGDGNVDAQDFELWKRNFGAVAAPVAVPVSANDESRMAALATFETVAEQRQTTKPRLSALGRQSSIDQRSASQPNIARIRDELAHELHGSTSRSESKPDVLDLGHDYDMQETARDAALAEWSAGVIRSSLRRFARPAIGN